MTGIVTRSQLVEHLTDRGVWHVIGDGFGKDFDVMILSKGLSLSRQYVRLDRVPGGFVVHHGKYRELKALQIP